jgi:hypothetical protein
MKPCNKRAGEIVRQSIGVESEHPSQVVVDHYRRPEEFAQLDVWGELSEKAGLFRFGPDSIGFSTVFLAEAVNYSPNLEGGSKAGGAPGLTRLSAKLE